MTDKVKKPGIWKRIGNGIMEFIGNIIYAGPR